MPDVIEGIFTVARYSAEKMTVTIEDKEKQRSLVIDDLELGKAPAEFFLYFAKMLQIEKWENIKSYLDKYQVDYVNTDVSNLPIQAVSN